MITAALAMVMALLITTSRSECAEITCDVVVVNQAWRLLKLARYGQSNQEHAGFIVRDADGDLHFMIWHYQHEFCRATYPGALPRNAVAIIHTHPNSVTYPSDGDAQLALRTGLPVYVVARTMIEASLPVLVREIRAALSTARNTIRTVHGFGYAFAGDIRKTSVAGALRECGPLHLLLHPEREFHLARGENVVGRDPTADVFIASTSVSRRHAVITTDEETAIVADLKSKNGTRIDGVMIVSPAPLRSGCVVTFGAIEVVYRFTFPNAETETL